MTNNIYVVPSVPVTIVSGDTTIYLNNNKKGEDKKMRRKTEMCECPQCGDIDGRIEDYEFDIDCLWIKCYCPKCEASWSEYATLTYDGYNYDGKTYDADGKECTDI